MVVRIAVVHIKKIHMYIISLWLVCNDVNVCLKDMRATASASYWVTQLACMYLLKIQSRIRAREMFIKHTRNS
jgi:hypothetical protein